MGASTFPILAFLPLLSWAVSWSASTVDLGCSHVLASSIYSQLYMDNSGPVGPGEAYQSFITSLCSIPLLTVAGGEGDSSSQRGGVRAVALPMLSTSNEFDVAASVLFNWPEGMSYFPGDYSLTQVTNCRVYRAVQAYKAAMCMGFTVRASDDGQSCAHT